MKVTSMLLALAVAAPLAAQQPDSAKRPAMPMRPGAGMGMGPGMMQGPMHGMMGAGQMPMMEMMGPMMRTMAYNPTTLLTHKDVLKLTDQQVTRLTALRDAMTSAHDSAMRDMHTHMQELQSLMNAATPDTVAMKPHFQAALAAMAKAHWAMLVGSTQARTVLDATQRARVEGWADAMEHRGMMQGTMMRRPGSDSASPRPF